MKDIINIVLNERYHVIHIDIILKKYLFIFSKNKIHSRYCYI